MSRYEQARRVVLTLCHELAKHEIHPRHVAHPDGDERTPMAQEMADEATATDEPVELIFANPERFFWLTFVAENTGAERIVDYGTAIEDAVGGAAEMNRILDQIAAEQEAHA